jgi:preprotein translocase subunit SecD
MNKNNTRWFVVILVIVVVAVWIDLPNNPGIHVMGINRDFKTHLGLDLVGGTQALLEADLPAGTAVDASAMQTAKGIIESRVNSLGVSEAVVQLAGERRILVEIPGIEDPEQAIATIKGTALLEFADLGDTYLPAGTVIKTDYAISSGSGTTPEATPPNGTPTTDSSVVTPNTTSQSQTGTSENVNATPEVPTETDKVWHTVMTGADLKNAQVTMDELGKYAIEIDFNDKGAKVFADYTTSNVGKYLAIVLDKVILSAPVIKSPITGGHGIISGGNFTSDSANNLAIQLRYGALPVPLRVIESRTIGPTLGQDSLQKSMIAGAIGLLIAILFMTIYYRIPGIVADIVIMIYASATFALFRSIPVTLTLSGIAGLILSTGSALDANILIFERFKEELRAGKNPRTALDLGWHRAWPSIRDSNAAALITCAILFWFGSTFGATIVKGFAVTLFLGVAVSLFTAIFITRTFLDIILSNFKPSNLSRWFGI